MFNSLISNRKYVHVEIKYAEQVLVKYQRC